MELFQVPPHGSTRCTDVLECKRARENKTQPLQRSAYFWLLRGMNVSTSVQNGESLWVRGDREREREETGLSIPGLHIAVPYGG